MNLTKKITELCDHWWTELSHSKSETIRPVAEKWLALLGWSRTEPVYLEHAACGFVGLANDSKRIVFYFTMPGELDTPSVVMEKGLDYCETTLMLVGEAQLEHYDYVVITDLNRSYLYDATTDDLLLAADSPQLFSRDMMEALLHDDVARGALDELRREPSSYVARQLRTWIERWTLEMSREPYGSEAIAHAVMDRILIMRFLYDHPIYEAPEWSYKSRFTNVISSAYESTGVSTKRVLVELMNDLASTWNIEIFELDAAMERFISKSTVVVSMLQEIALLAKIKFTTSGILESFNYGEASEKARVRLVPEANEGREMWLGKLNTAEVGNSRMEIDVLDEGYRAIPFWFDRLKTTMTRLSVTDQFKQRFEEYASRAPELKEGHEMDLFSWSEATETTDGSSPEAKIDLLALCVEKGITIWAASERQHRTAQIVLYLHIISLYNEGVAEFGQFPTMSQSFGERPSMLDTDKQWIYQGRPSGESEWDVV
jgi:hypothetical protein